MDEGHMSTIGKIFLKIINSVVYFDILNHFFISYSENKFGNNKFIFHHDIHREIYKRMLQEEEDTNAWLACKCYIITEGFQFMPFSLVRLRTFRLSTWVS